MPHRPTRPTLTPEQRLRAAGLLVPPWLTPADIQTGFGFQSEEEARAAILRGEFGPYVATGDRLCVLKDSLLAHLKARELTAPDQGAR